MQKLPSNPNPNKQVKQMEKKIEDYLKYYIGQKVQVFGEKENDFRTLIGYDTSWFNPCRLEVDGNLSAVPTDRLKLVLRQLSSMTEEEAIEVARLTEWEPHFTDVKVRRNDYGDLIVTWQGSVEGGEQFNATGDCFFCYEQFHYLLSKGFDMFELIDSKLAISSEEVNNRL